MVATQVTLTDFLTQNKTQFVIPVYQRNYDWTEVQCKQLLEDIIEIGSREGSDSLIKFEMEDELIIKYIR